MDTGQVSIEAVRAQLARMLDSDTFRTAERSRTLLRFVVDEALQGRADRLKDYVLGAEALGRGERFDPRTDPIARVEASRLRSRLDVYYATEGSADPVRISLPRGGYAPMFEWRPASATTPAVESHPAEQAVNPAPAAVMTRVPAAVYVGAAIAVALLAGIGGWLLRGTGNPVGPPETRLDLITPPTTDPVSLAVSPDGRAVVFVAAADGRSRLWIRPLDAAARPLAGTDYASLPFWSPDGRSIGFFADGRIKRYDLETRLVRVMAAALVPAGATWNRDDVILHPIVPDGPLYRTSAAGSRPEPVTQLSPGQTGHRGPAFLPDGRHFLFHAMGSAGVRGIHVGELGTTVVRRLLDADSPAIFVPPNHILYVQHATLFAHRIDPNAITLVGDPAPLAEGLVAEPMGGIAAFSGSAGTIAYRSGVSAGKRQFVWVDRSGSELSRVGAPEAAGPSYASLSPDGRRLAVQRSAGGNTDIWIVDAQRGVSDRFTTDAQADIAPHWSPRGDRIAYASQDGGVFQLFEKPFDGPPAPLLSTPQQKQVTDWSRDGRYLLFRTVSVASHVDMDVWALPLDGDREPFAVVRTPFEERDAQFSPDGTWIAYHSNESGQHEVYVQPFRRAGERVPISKGGGVQARWRSDGRELFYVTLDGQLVAVPVAYPPDGTLQPGTAVPLFTTRIGAVQGVALHSYIAAADGQRFLIESVAEETPPPVSIVLNWNPPGE